MATGVAQASKLKDMGYNIDDGGRTLDANLNKLFNYRGRFIYQSEIELIAAIQQLNAQDRIKIHPLESQYEGRYIAFSKNTPLEIIEKISNAMVILRDSGELDRIFKLYVYFE